MGLGPERQRWAGDLWDHPGPSGDRRGADSPAAYALDSLTSTAWVVPPVTKSCFPSDQETGKKNPSSGSEKSPSGGPVTVHCAVSVILEP